MGELGSGCFGEGVESAEAQLPEANYALSRPPEAHQDSGKISWVWLGSTDLGVSVLSWPTQPLVAPQPALCPHQALGGAVADGPFCGAPRNPVTPACGSCMTTHPGTR